MAVKQQIKGLLSGAFGASCYGTNPLFALPLYAAGLTVASVLFYRYAIAVVLFGLWLTVFQRMPLTVTRRQFFALLFVGMIYSLSSLTLFLSYQYIDSGIATTILFVYPILVALIMFVFFHEKISRNTVAAIILTTMAILLFYKGKENQTLNPAGIFIALLSALCDASYMVGVKKIKALREINPSLITFYVMGFGTLIFFINLHFGTNLQLVDTPLLWGCVAGLAVLPTIVSLVTITTAVKIVGPTITAVLGAFEPMTAIIFGVCVFNEQMTFRIAAGIFLIISSVLTIMLPQANKQN